MLIVTFKPISRKCLHTSQWRIGTVTNTRKPIILYLNAGSLMAHCFEIQYFILQIEPNQVSSSEAHLTEDIYNSKIEIDG